MRPVARAVIARTDLSARCTQGMLQLDGARFCWTLEDPVRERKVAGGQWEWQSAFKVPGATAIPSGIYPLTISMSTRFGKWMPHIGDVPDFTGVRAHGGNTVENTEGCPLLGMIRSRCYVAQCKPATDGFIQWLEAALATGPQWIELRNPW